MSGPSLYRGWGSKPYSPRLQMLVIYDFKRVSAIAKKTHPVFLIGRKMCMYVQYYQLVSLRASFLTIILIFLRTYVRASTTISLHPTPSPSPYRTTQPESRLGQTPAAVTPTNVQPQSTNQSINCCPQVFRPDAVAGTELCSTQEGASSVVDGVVAVVP